MKMPQWRSSPANVCRSTAGAAGVALDPTGVYIAFDASAQVRGRTPSIKRAIALAEGPGREHEANPTQEKNTMTEPTLEAQARRDREGAQKYAEGRRPSPKLIGLLQQGGSGYRRLQATGGIGLRAGMCRDRRPDWPPRTRPACDCRAAASAGLDRQEETLARRKMSCTCGPFGDAEAACRCLGSIAVDRVLATNGRMAVSRAGAVDERQGAGRFEPAAVDQPPGGSHRVDDGHRFRGHRNRFGSLDWPGGASGLYPPALC